MIQRIAFVDTSLVDYQMLVSALDPAVEVVLINPDQDGWQQVAAALAGRSGIAAIDIFSHGAPGSVQLGSSVLTAGTLPGYAATLAEIGSHLAAGADILLYGCAVGAGSTGQEFLNQLAAASGADVAASTDTTGAAALGGNWVHEATAGPVETAALQAPAYQGSLAAPQIVKLFSTNDGVHGQELWITDGTAAGTTLLKDIFVGVNGSGPFLLTILGNGKVLFRAQDATNGQELWVTDGTAVGTMLLKDIFVGANGSSPGLFTTLSNGQVLFSAQDATNGFELWVTDGTAAGTTLLKDIFAGINSSFPSLFTTLGNGKVLFRAQDATNGQELWVTDGTTVGTALLKDINPGVNGSSPVLLTTLGNGQVLFIAQDASNGQELWVTDGTTAGTMLVKDINDATVSSQVATVMFDLVITPVNNAPTTTAVTFAALAEDSGARLISQVELLANAGDVDGDNLTASNLAIASGLGSLVDNGDGSWSYTPALNDDGAVSFSYTVSDGSLTTDGSATLDLTPVNDAPVANPDTLSATENTPVTYTAAQLLGNDTDVDNASLSIASVTSGLGGTAVLNADGSVSFTPTTHFNGAASFSYTASDGQASSNSASASASVTVNVGAVNDAPTTTAVILTAIAEDSGARLITQAELLANASDIDGDSLTATELAIAVGNGSLVDNSDGSWSYTPALNDDGAVSFSYTVSDGSLTAAGSATLDLTPVNDAPVANADTLVASEDQPVTYTAAQLLGNDTDVDNASLSIASVTSGLGGTAVLNGDGTVSFTPTTHFNGAATFSYTASDGQDSSNSASVTVNVGAVNDAPTTTAVILTAIAEDSGARLISQVELLANASDIDGDSLTATNLTIASGLGSLVDNGDGSWSYTPALNDDGAVSFSYMVSDGSLTAAGSATLDFTPVNDAPVANPDTLSATENTPAIYTAAQLLGNDTDVDNASLSIASVTSGLGGTAVLNGDGTVSFSPDANFSGAASFSYTASDSSASSNSASVTVNVGAVNDAPTTSPVTLAAIAEDSGARLISQVELLTNASDIDGDNLTATGLAIAVGNGSLVDNGDGSWSYTPALNDDGAVSFSYTVSDGSLTAVGSATLDLTPVNDAPVANPDTLSATENTPAIYTAAQLLGNDTDVDNASLSIASVTSGTGGTAVLNGDGTVSFSPDANFSGAASFSYTASDGSTSSNSASVAVNLGAVNDAPVLASPLADRAFIRGAEFAFAIPVGSFSDADGDSLSYTATLADGSPLPGWLQFNPGTVTFSGNPAIPDVGDFNVRVTASDPTGLLVSDVFALSITTAPGDIVGTDNADVRNGTAGNNILYGLAGDDQLNGGAGNDQLVGGEGNDTLNGDTGNDTMYGGSGDDRYVVNAARDVVVENADGGHDLVQSSVNYTLGANLEDLVLTGTSNLSGTGNGLDNVLTGNSGRNTLTGGAGNDTLDGGTGRDTLIGGLGNDTYVVDDNKDTVNEALGGGVDTVRSLVRAYTLTANVENLLLLGSALSGTGNALANVITGNSLSNTLSGGAGDDQLFGLDGNDTLTGGSGSDSMTGGVGNDIYGVDNIGDVTTEAAGEGLDTVQSSISYALGLHVENLTLTGGAAINGTGNELANRLVGNTGANVLDGGLGADTLLGGAGNDSYLVDDAGDLVQEFAGGGTDTVVSSVSSSLGANIERLTLTGSSAINGTGNALANLLLGNSAANDLAGGLGNDTLTGGAGADRFVFSTAPSAANIDTVTDFIAGQDQLVLDALVFTGLGLHNQFLDASMFRSGAGVTTAGDANDHVIYNTNNGRLYYDADGAGGSAAVQFATIQEVPALDPGSIWIMN